mmetsp:Transcript_45215/g.134957  ORF Transcript_45215/g.134957 Transcript_45215/m.134957 type:complete len:201 (-) Transcript_45215:36-638(-)|eukprot:366485-Chlamydomonas_euryale.AAC.29
MHRLLWPCFQTCVPGGILQLQLACELPAPAHVCQASTATTLAPLPLPLPPCCVPQVHTGAAPARAARAHRERCSFSCAQLAKWKPCCHIPSGVRALRAPPRRAKLCEAARGGRLRPRPGACPVSVQPQPTSRIFQLRHMALPKAPTKTSERRRVACLRRPRGLHGFRVKVHVGTWRQGKPCHEGGPVARSLCAGRQRSPA